MESAVREEQEELRDSLLLDIYGGLLTQKQREALHMQLDLDYSLSEIAENQGVTRQAALDAVKRGIARLRSGPSCRRLMGNCRLMRRRTFRRSCGGIRS